MQKQGFLSWLTAFTQCIFMSAIMSYSKLTKFFNDIFGHLNQSVTPINDIDRVNLSDARLLYFL